ncbi:hypothetical protein N0V85_000635 [Neurospora sp. IMI 360204]|nr:hypothetical protein N0V85_000635 [Neurospora sp. IMI 360204]
MCRINIIHFSHHDFHQDSLTTCNCNLFNPSFSIVAAAKLNLLPRPTEDEFMTHRQPQHQFVLCPTHPTTTPCLLQKFHHSSAVGGVNAAGCPNLAVTAEYHPLSMIIDNNENSESELASVDQDDLGLGGDDVPRFQSLSQARTAIFSTADEIHKQKVVIDKHLVEAAEVMEGLFLDFAHARATMQPLPAQRLAFFREFERPLNQCAELCHKIREADESICENFKAFLQRRKGMSNLLMAVEKKDALQETINSGGYSVSKARQDLTELSASNIREVCEGSLRRGRELSTELVRLLDAVSNFVQPVQQA